MPLNPRLSALALCGALVAGAWIAVSQAQIPDTFTNLKVLPKDTGKRELVGVMRGFTDALGVRCKGCHVPGPDPNSLDGYDFASDKPEKKNVARQMMRMVQAINSDYIAKAGIDDPAQVRCVTCHRGVEHPETLDQVLLEVVKKDGVTAAQDRYRELRDQYYGSGSYDFSSETLLNLADELANSDSLDAAVAMVRLDLEFHPDEAQSYAGLGQLLALEGKTDEAVKSLEHALQLSPDNPRLQRMLDRIRGGSQRQPGGGK